MSSKSYVLETSMALDAKSDLIKGYFVSVLFRPGMQRQFEVIVYEGDTDTYDVSKSTRLNSQVAWTLSEAMEYKERYISRISLSRKLPAEFANTSARRWFDITNQQIDA